MSSVTNNDQKKFHLYKDVVMPWLLPYENKRAGQKDHSLVRAISGAAVLGPIFFAQKLTENKVLKAVPVVLGAIVGTVARLVERVFVVLEFFLRSIFYAMKGDKEMALECLKEFGKSLGFLLLTPIEPLALIPFLSLYGITQD